MWAQKLCLVAIHVSCNNFINSITFVINSSCTCVFKLYYLPALHSAVTKALAISLLSLSWESSIIKFLCEFFGICKLILEKLLYVPIFVWSQPSRTPITCSTCLVSWYLVTNFSTQHSPFNQITTYKLTNWQGLLYMWPDFG